MENTNSAVLITTAIKPPTGVIGLKMTSMAKRKITAKAAVFFWASSGIKKIVIADATGQTLLNDADLLLLSQMNVQVE